MIDSMKIILIALFYNYTISDTVREINRDKKLQTHFKIQNNFTEQQFYDYFNRFDP